MSDTPRLQFNPDPIRIVEVRAGEPAPYRWRCEHADGRGRCSSRDTRGHWNASERQAEFYCERHHPLRGTAR